jgi:polysaccharide export outer membrane protein
MADWFRCSALFVLVLASSGCAILPASAPTVSEIENQSNDDPARRFIIVDINDDVVAAVSQLRQQGFPGSFISRSPPADLRIAIGYILQISIIEVGSGIFGQGNNAATLGSETASAQATTLQPMTVERDGYITVPFAGRVRAEGTTPSQLGADIEHLLAKKALQPQVQVAVVSNGANSSTVGGEVNHPSVLPLALYGTRLLDLIASAGGARYPAYETNVHLTRHGRSTVVSLQNIIEDPRNNIFLQPKDSIYLTREPRTFTAFGATSKVGHYDFETAHLSLAEAVAKAGGFVDATSDPGGAFLFRFEPSQFVATIRPDLPPQHEPRVPVLYRLNLREGHGYFQAQHFPMRDKDVIVIADAQGAQLLKALILIRGISSIANDFKPGQSSNNPPQNSFAQ